MYFLSVSSSWPSRNAVLGVWPMARNTPAASTSRLRPVGCALEPHAGHAVACRCPALRPARGSRPISILGLFSARSAMIFDARSSIAAMDQVDPAGELAQVGRFFDGRIAAADHDQRLVAKPRQRPVAHGAGADAVVLERVFRRQPQIIGPGAGGHDHGLGLDRSPSLRA